MTLAQGEQVLLRAREAFRSAPRPAYVGYLLDRRERTGGMPDLASSYTLKVWCRTSDGRALMRRARRDVATGELIGDRVVFDGRIDPGPPTADIFEPATFAPASPPVTPSPAQTVPPLIGGSSVRFEREYRVTAAREEGKLVHLSVEPRRDRDRNRIDELWADATTFAVTRVRVRDHLYFAYSAEALPEEFDVRFTQRDGIPLVTSIHGETPGAMYEVDYTFRAIAFPASLPDWYFDPHAYGAHGGDAPA